MAVVEESEIALRDVLRVYASTNLIDIGRRSIAVVVAGDGSGDTDVFRSIDDNDTMAEEVKAGLKENSGLHKIGFALHDIQTYRRMNDGIELRKKSLSRPPLKGRREYALTDILRIIYPIDK